LGTLCGVCLAPFTGGASLGMCAACAGVGFVAGSVIEKVSESNGQISQAPPEAYNLLSKSMEENKRLLGELRNQYEQMASKENKTEARLQEAKRKSEDPNLTEEERKY
jgi:cell division septum initiation protein DivIVA